MSAAEQSVHPYIPNSVAEIRGEMLNEIGVRSVEQLLDVIPARLRFRRTLNLPAPLAESELRNHVEKILSGNKTCKEYLNFLGAGCWRHYVPAVCDEIAHRAEFLTAFGGMTYSDLGKWQAFFEFQSMLGELLELDAVALPTYDWGSAAGFAIRMASRITNRSEVLIPKTISPERLSAIRNLCQSEIMPGHIDVKLIDYDRETGSLDLGDLKRVISSKTAAVYFENPSYLGGVSEGVEISDITHGSGAQCIVGVDPLSLGIMAPPGDYDADIVCGELQPLGIHLNFGGGVGGFIASRDEELYVSQYPSILVGMVGTEREGEFGFGFASFERTHFMQREKGKDFTGTTVGLWAIVAAVYMAILGPNGMKKLGEVIIKKSHYAARLLSDIDGVRILFSPHFFKEFVVNFGKEKAVRRINENLLDYKIFGGKDITKEFPELGNSALYCVTETHTKQDLDKLADALRGILK